MEKIRGSLRPGDIQDVSRQSHCMWRELLRTVIIHKHFTNRAMCGVPMTTSVPPRRRLVLGFKYKKMKKTKTSTAEEKIKVLSRWRGCFHNRIICTDVLLFGICHKYAKPR